MRPKKFNTLLLLPKTSVLVLLCLFYFSTGKSYAQQEPVITLNPGDIAPALQVRTWMNGTQIPHFEKGKVYVLEFWATWCGPCIAAMPHLSDLAAQYKNKADFIGVNVSEKTSTTVQQVRAFVDSIGSRMNYRVAIDEGNVMSNGWMRAAGQQGIPKTFVVNAEGRLAWIGHPMYLDTVLKKIVNNDWDINVFLAKRDFDSYLGKLDISLLDTLNTYAGNEYKKDYYGKPEALLLYIEEIVKKEPALKYAPLVGIHTFEAFLKTNLPKAYEFGQTLIKTATYEEPAFHGVIGSIKYFSDKFNLPPDIYRLGAEAHEAKLKWIPYPSQFNMVKLYKTMAEWYWRANDFLKAVPAQDQAIKELKMKNDASPGELAALEEQRQKYKTGNPEN